MILISMPTIECPTGTRMRFGQALRRSLLAPSAIVCVSCSATPTAPEANDVRVAEEWVTGAAARALGPDGLFILPPPDAHQEPGEIDATAARQQALAWAQMVANLPPGGTNRIVTNPREAFEARYGGPIDFYALSACGRTYYTKAAYGPMPDEAPASVHNAFGPHWIVRLCTRAGDVPIVLAVASNSDLAIVDGQLQSPSLNSGSWFNTWSFSRGTPLSRALPLEPEAAVALVFRATRIRIAEVPEFVQATLGMPPAPIVPQCGYWRILLEAPVHGTGLASGAAHNSREVTVWRPSCTSGEIALMMARDPQPDTALHLGYPFFLDSASGGGMRIDSVRIPVRRPYSFEAVRLSP